MSRAICSSRPLCFKSISSLPSFSPIRTIRRARPSRSPITDVERILSFWFHDHFGPKYWFRASASVDTKMKIEFGDLVNQARTSALDTWTKEPKSTLALLLLLDQFPRNIFRGSPDAFASDAKALSISIRAIARGFDLKVGPSQQQFFYLPLMHDEQLLSQVAAVSLYNGLKTRTPWNLPAHEFAFRGSRFARQHMDIIATFGRFPSRNAALGRQSTADEQEFLVKYPNGPGLIKHPEP